MGWLPPLSLLWVSDTMGPFLCTAVRQNKDTQHGLDLITALSTMCEKGITGSVG